MNERKAAVEMGAEEAKALWEQAVKAREQSYSCLLYTSRCV